MDEIPGPHQRSEEVVKRDGSWYGQNNLRSGNLLNVPWK